MVSILPGSLFKRSTIAMCLVVVAVTATSSLALASPVPEALATLGGNASPPQARTSPRELLQPPATLAFLPCVPDPVNAGGSATSCDITLVSNGNAVSAATIRIDYDESVLSYASFASGLAAPFTGSCSQNSLGAPLGDVVDCSILAFVPPPLPTMPDGSLITLNFTTLNPPVTVVTPLAFVSPPTSLGSSVGSSVPLQTSDGSVTVQTEGPPNVGGVALGSIGLAPVAQRGLIGGRGLLSSVLLVCGMLVALTLGARRRR